jgi:hypothetical protein
LSGNKVAVAIVPVAALVAAGLVYLRLRVQPPTVPAYSLVSVTGEVDARGARAGTPPASFDIEVRPASPVQGAVGARAFLLQGDEVHAWDPPFSVAGDGTVRITGAAARLFAGFAPGTWDVALAVGRPELLPTAPRDVLRARDAGAHVEASAGWRLVVAHIHLEG